MKRRDAIIDDLHKIRRAIGRAHNFDVHRIAATQGDVWWADLPEPAGSCRGLRRPIVGVQGNPLNRSQLRPWCVYPLTSNITWAGAPGNTLLAAKATGLPKDSVANVSQIIALDRSLLTERVGRLASEQFAQIFHGVDVVPGR